MYPILGVDHGAGGNYDLMLGVVDLLHGGTGAQTQQGAADQILNFEGLSRGSLLLFNGKDWTPLAPGADGQGLALSNGMPGWSAAIVSIPKSASIVTLHESLVDYPNSAQLHVDPGCGIAIDESAGHASFSVDGTVARTNQAQELLGPVSLGNGPVILGGHSQGINFRCTKHTINLSCMDAGADHRVVIPDVGTDSEFLMSEGDQVVSGLKAFSTLYLPNSQFTVGQHNATITIPEATDALVNQSSAQVLRNKSFQGIALEDVANCLEFKKSSGSIIISAANPTAERHYQLPDANTDGDIAIKSGSATAGGVCFGDGNTIRFTTASGLGLPLISAGQGAPSFAVLGTTGGGTGIPSYQPGDLLIAGSNGLLTRVPIGKVGQVLTVTSKGVEWK
jgi:hypothetical protein